MIRNAFLLLSGNAMSSALSLARNLLLARLIAVEDYGIAMTFGLVISLIEMASAFGLQQQIVQSERGDDPHFQAALQGFHVLRGLFGGTAIFFGAGLIGDFVSMPELADAYRVVAIVPVLIALEHFDLHRLNRGSRFGPLVLADLLPTIAVLLAVWPTVWIFGDWRAMLAMILIRASSRTILSHLLAERPYRVAFDPGIIRDSVAFGWPLLINNVLLFLVLQGDRLLVIRELGPEVMAIFSMGITLTLTPTLVMGRSLQSLFLPRLSTEADPARFDRLAVAVLQASMLNGGITMAGVFVLAPLVVQIVLGADYLPLLPYLGPLAALQALRVLKSGGTVVALSKAQTSNAMISNIFRAATLPVIWWVLAQGGGLHWVIAIGVVGEAMGYAASLVLVRVRLGQRIGPVVPALGVTIVMMAAISVLTAAPGMIGFGGFPYGWGALIMAALLALQLCVMSELVRWLRGLARRVLAPAG